MFDSIRRALADYAHELLRAFNLLSARQKALFLLFLVVFVSSGFSLIYTVNDLFTVEVPAYAGTLSEGVLGVPRFINPLLATSDADLDLTALVYSGLMRASKDGSLVPDLAESYSVSDDNLTYTFTLKPNLTWHDGKPLTADDVVFTIKEAQEPNLKSPKRANWEGVTVEAPDPSHIIFTLKHPYSLFLENTTLGIIPKHIWGTLDIDAFTYSTKNAEPIGSGPYRLVRTEKSASGIPTIAHLAPFHAFALGEPYIQELLLHFYPNESALLSAIENSEVEMATTLNPESAESLKAKGVSIVQSPDPLPRIFAVFWNQNSSHIFTDAAIRTALDRAIDKEALISSVLKGYAAPLDGPLPPGTFGYTHTDKADSGVVVAKKLLEENGWKMDAAKGVYSKTVTTKAKGKTPAKSETSDLSFTLATSDAPELRAAAEFIARAWREMGAQVALEVFPVGDLNQNVIRPRKYDALLFGEIVGRNPDPFAFWHSSQRLDPGLGVALYANAKVDSLLEKARTAPDSDERAKLLADFQAEIRKDDPAVFLYAPSFIFTSPTSLRGMTLSALGAPTDHYTDVATWYVETDRVWKWFVR